jgi:hypothetical protein
MNLRNLLAHRGEYLLRGVRYRRLQGLRAERRHYLIRGMCPPPYAYLADCRYGDRCGLRMSRTALNRWYVVHSYARYQVRASLRAPSVSPVKPQLRILEKPCQSTKQNVN